jgi:hypothetical protein
LNNYNLQGYLEQFRVNDFKSRGVYNINNRLYIGRGGLDPIATKFGKLIICFETETIFVRKKNKEDLQHALHYFFQYES